MRKNIFVVGREDFNIARLQALKKAHQYTFHGLLDYADIRARDDKPIQELLTNAEEQLRTFPDAVDAIVGYWDFPVSDMVPILCRKFGLPSASLTSVLKCEHKYWSRIEQRKVIPKQIPHFTNVDPFDEHALAKIDLAYPFWIKPIKSFRSHLAFRIRNEHDFHANIAIIREHIPRLGNPFNYILDQIDLPDHLADIDGNTCIAEEALRGRQCTVEGYAWQGEIHVYGVVDSVRDANRTSFARYQYPSTLPRRVQHNMRDATREVMSFIGFDNSMFNIEFFYDERHDRIALLEINPRTSQSHTDLFEKVDGASNFEIMVDVALGNRPDFQPRQGIAGCAAKCFIRRYKDALVTAVPGADAIERVQERFPGTLVQVNVSQGMRLSQLRNQDSYSYEIASVFLNADNQDDLLQKYRACVGALPFQFAPVGE